MINYLNSKNNLKYTTLKNKNNNNKFQILLMNYLCIVINKIDDEQTLTTTARDRSIKANSAHLVPMGCIRYKWIQKFLSILEQTLMVVGPTFFQWTYGCVALKLNNCMKKQRWSYYKKKVLLRKLW